MGSKTTKEHQNESSENITCGIITLSDSRDINEDLSGDYIKKEIEKRYVLKSRKIIKDEKTRSPQVLSAKQDDPDFEQMWCDKVLPIK